MPSLKIADWKGLRNTVSAERMEPGDLIAAVNVLLLNDGRIARRMGQMVQHTALMGERFHSVWSDGGANGFCVKGRTLHQLDATTLALRAITAVNSDDPMAYCAVDDRVYYTNGVDTGVVHAGVRHSWGLPQVAPPSVQLTPGALPGGAYLYALTHIRDDGQESGAGAGAVEIPDNAGLFFSGLPASTDDTVTFKALYLSAPNGEVLYRALLMTNATLTANVYAPVELAYPIDTLHLSPAPAGQALAYYQGRMWVGAEDHLFASQPFSPELFDLREYLPARGRVTVLAARPDDGAMLLGTTAGVGWVLGEQFSQLRYQHAHDDPVLQGSLLQVPGALFGDGSAGQTDVPVWAGTQSIYAATPPDWVIRPVTLAHMQIDFRGRVAAVFDRARGQYLASISS